MLFILLTMNIIFSILFTMMNHPLSMGAILLLQTLTITLATGNMAPNLWFSYILFLIMVGGMLILFMYMTSIASNEKFKFNKKMFFSLLIIPPTMITLMKMNFTISNNETLSFATQSELVFSLNKFINMPTIMILLFMMIYLFLALVATVKMTNFKQGSIRQMN